MVINGGSRGGAADIAAHLLRTDTNERAELRELRGTIADTLTDGLLEMEAVASGARSKLHFYHANIDSRIHEQLTEAQKDRSIELLGEKLGLAGQPRAVMEHVKDGRHHLHVVWSRIDLATMTAIPDSHNYRIHEEVARQLEREFGFEHTQGAHIGRDGKDRPGRTPSDDDMQMAARTGIDPKAFRAHLAELFQAADSGKAFAAALEAEGATLANGDKRNVFVVLDREGGTHALNKKITGLTAAGTRGRLADLDAASLPSVEAAREAITSRRANQVDENSARRTDESEAERIAGIKAQSDAAPAPEEGNDYSETDARRADEEAEAARDDELHGRTDDSHDEAEGQRRADEAEAARDDELHGRGADPASPDEARQSWADRLRGFAADNAETPRKQGRDTPKPERHENPSPAAESTQRPKKGRGGGFEPRPGADDPGRIFGKAAGAAIDAAYRAMGAGADAIGSLFEAKPGPRKESAAAPPPARDSTPTPEASAARPEPARDPPRRKSPARILLEKGDERLKQRQAQGRAGPDHSRDRERDGRERHHAEPRAVHDGRRMRFSGPGFGVGALSPRPSPPRSPPVSRQAGRMADRPMMNPTLSQAEAAAEVRTPRGGGGRGDPPRTETATTSDRRPVARLVQAWTAGAVSTAAGIAARIERVRAFSQEHPDTSVIEELADLYRQLYRAIHHGGPTTQP